MSKENNGGHAFPTADVMDGEIVGEQSGMSVRDYFAAKAMEAYASALPVVLMDSASQRGRMKALASQAYALADAMLAERAK